MPTFVSCEDILTAARSEAIGSAASSITALQDTQMIERIEQINAEFINAAHTRHSLGGFSWMEKVTNFQTKAATTLNGAISAGAATLDLTSASDFDTSGRIVIETGKYALDFVDYESKATNQLTVSTATGAETVNMAHSDAENVEKLYPVASDLGKVKQLTVDSSVHVYERLDKFPRAGYFTIYGNYFFMPRGMGARDVTVHYIKKPATITLLGSTTDIPTEYQRYAIEKLKAHIYMIRRKREDIAISLQLAEEALQYALSMDSGMMADSEFTTLPLPY